MYIEGIGRVMNFYVRVQSYEPYWWLGATFCTQQQLVASNIPCWVGMVKASDNLIAMEMSVTTFNIYMVKDNLTTNYKEELYLDVWTVKKPGKLSSLLKLYQYKSSFTREKYISSSQPYTSTNGGGDLLPKCRNRTLEKCTQE